MLFSFIDSSAAKEDVLSLRPKYTVLRRAGADRPTLPRQNITAFYTMWARQRLFSKYIAKCIDSGNRLCYIVYIQYAQYVQ